MADKEIAYLLNLNASSAVAGLRSATDASTALATAERAEATAALAANRAHAGASTAMGRVSVSAGQLSSGLGNLGSQAADVGVQLAMGMNPIMIMVQQGPQIAGAITQLGGLGSAWKALGGVVTAAAPALTAASGALAAVGVVYMEITGIIGDYTAATDAARAANESFTAALRPLNEALEAARDRQTVLRGALGSNDPKAYLAIADISAQADKKQMEATKGLREERDRLILQYGEMSAAQERSTAGITLEARIKEIDKEIAVVHEQADAWASAEVTNYTLQQAIEGTGSATRKSTKAADADAAAWDRWIATAVGAKDAAHALLMAKNALEMNRPGITKQEQDVLMYPVTQDAWDKIGAKAKEVGEESAKAAREEWIDIAIAMGAQLEVSGKEAVTAVKSGLFSAQGMSSASGMINQASSGPGGAIAALSAIPVYGQLIAAIVGLTDAIGKGLLDDMHEWIMGLMDTISNLPTLLSDFVEKLIMEGVPKLFKSRAGFFGNLFEDLPKHVGQIIKALIMSIGGLLRHLIDDMPTVLVKGIAAIFSPENWAEVGRSIAEAFVEAFKGIGKGPEGKGMLASGGGWWQRDFGDIAGDMILGKNREGILHDIWKGPQGKGGISNLFGLTGLVGSFDSGGYIPRTGLAMVHRGEYVSTSAETSRGQRRTSDGTGAGVTNVNIGPVYGGREAARQIADLLREHMGSNGQRLTIQGA